MFDCNLVLRRPVLRQEVRAHYAKICKEIETEAMILRVRISSGVVCSFHRSNDVQPVAGSCP